MRRWTDHDKDSYRLPEGMERIGYDSDTRRYTFRDRQGAIWEGSPGEEFGGELRQISGPTLTAEDDDDEPIRLMPNAPIPTPGVGEPKAQDASTSSTFRDFVPAGKIVTADVADKSAAGSSKSPISAKSIKSMWKRVRAKDNSATPKAQAVVKEAVSQNKADSETKKTQGT